MEKYRNILIAVDSSRHSLKAAEQGLQLAQELGAKVALVFVLDPNLEAGNVDAGIMPTQAKAQLEEEAQLTFETLKGQYPKISMEHFMPEGQPQEELLKLSHDWQADLIVMGTHGRTGLLHLLMGSVAEHLLRHSKVPVLVVPSKS